MRILVNVFAVLLLATIADAEDGPAVYSRLLQSTAWVRTTTQGVGTGWVIDAKRRWLITNLHIVGDQDRVEAFFAAEKDGPAIGERSHYLENQKALHEQGRAVWGRTIVRDATCDLALVELETLPENITALRIAEAVPGPGEQVHSVGHRQDADALWLNCQGQVRQLGRLTEGYFWRGKKLAVDAPCLIAQSPILPGDSGGPLVNQRGEVVGVLSGLRQAPAAAIAIQATEVRKLLAKANKSNKPADVNAKEAVKGTDIYRQLSDASVWVRPSATEGRTAGWVIDKQRKLIITTAAGAGSFDLVEVLFPRIEKGELLSGLNDYADRIGLRQKGLLVRGLVLYRDSKRDLALIELESLPEKAAELPLEKAEPKPAEKVHALSHPSGVELLWLYSAGTVRQAASVELVAAQMDESVKPRTLLLQIPHQASSSGGPVVNEQGRVVGLLAAKEGAQQQLGYAIASAELDTFMESARPLFAPTTADEFNRRGKLLFSRGVAAAIAALDEACRRSPKNRRYFRDLAEAELPSNAKAALIHATQIDGMTASRSLESQAFICLIQVRIGKTDGVEKMCDEILAKDKTIALAYLVRASLHSGKKALADLDEAIVLAPQLVDAYRLRAKAHLELGNDETALADYSRAIELDPYEPETIRLRVAFHLKKREPKRAAADYERLIELLPKDAKAHCGLAEAWLAHGDEAKAISALVAAVRWEPGMLKAILEDVLKPGAQLAQRWPDDQAKRAEWYERALQALGPAIADMQTRRQIEEAVRSKMPEWDAKQWGEELEKRIRAITK